MQTAGRTHRRRAERKPQGWTDLLAGVPQGTPAPNPPYLTGGYKSTGNSLKIKRNPAGYMGSSFQTTIENQFDYICKRAMDDERKDYMKALSRQSKRETLFSDMGDYLVSQFATVDSYPSDFHIFTLNDSTVGVESDLLSEALRNLTDKKREIILLYYFMDMNDTEIADLLKLNRSTVYRHRTSGLAFIKEFMEENEE